jgi:hypothetical protein
MATITVKLQATTVGYDPDNRIKPGDTVYFQRDGRSDEIIVTFPDGTPFANASVTLGTALTEQPETVRSNASVQRYHFHFPEVGGGKDAPGTVPGDLDVVDDF